MSAIVASTYKRIALIDLSAVFRRAWHASENEEVSAAYNRTISTIVTSTAGFDAVAICADRPPYKRRDISPEYKAHREQAPAVMYEQLRAVEAEIERLGYHLVGAAGYEADDVIATIAAWSENAGHQTTIFSADKDLLALVTAATSVVSTATGQTYGPDEVAKKFGVSPAQIPDWLALVGDASDGIAGVDGCGPKTAARWLNEIGPLTAILMEPEKLPPRFSVAVAASKDKILLSRNLAQLMNAPINPEEIMVPKQAVRTEPRNQVWVEDDEPPPPSDNDVPPDNGAPTQAQLAREAEFRARAAAAKPVISKIEAAADVSPRPATSAQAHAVGSPATDRASSILQEPPVARAAREESASAAAAASSSSQAIAPVEWDRALEPRTAGQAWNIANALFESRVFGDWPNPNAILAAVMTGREMGIGASTSLRSFHLIEGKLAPSAHLIVGLVKRSPACMYFQLVEEKDGSCTYETHRVGNPKPTRMTYTREQAQAADLYRPSRNGKPSNWTKREAEMLRKTCASQLARAEYPGETMGLYSYEELEGGA